MTQTNIPSNILTYGKALLQAPWRFNIVFVSLVAGVSHDFLTRALHKKYSWKELLKNMLNTHLFEKGYLIIDETDVDKSYAKAITGLSWIFSHRKNKHIFGLHMVVICWTNKTITIPLAWKIYQKRSGKTKIDLAIELIEYCLFHLRIDPNAFLFDAFYASESLLKYLKNHNQSFFSQLPKNRLFNNMPLSKHKKGIPYWTQVGYIKGHIHVQIVRNRKKYYITNKIGITRKEQLGTYKIRWMIENIFRFVKQELGFEACQSTSLQAQHNHFGTCFFMYAILQDIAVQTQMTDYRIKQKAILHPDYLNQLDLAAYLYSA